MPIVSRDDLAARRLAGDVWSDYVLRASSANGLPATPPLRDPISVTPALILPPHGRPHYARGVGEGRQLAGGVGGSGRRLLFIW